MKGPLRIDRVFAFVVVDKDGSEGVPGIMNPQTREIMPLMGADVERVDSLRPLVQEWATRNHRPVRLVVFEQRVEKEMIYPEGSTPS